MNPCPCGFRGSALRACVCDSGRVSNYMARLSGPLLDRFDLHVEVPHVDYQTLLSEQRTGEGSPSVRERVMVARQLQEGRAAEHRGAPTSNAGLSAEQVVSLARPDATGERLLLAYAKRHVLSSRAVHRVLRVARTIADLAGVAPVRAAHVAEALSLRVLDRPLCSLPNE